MPLYTFRDTVTGEILDNVQMRITDYDQYLTCNPTLERYFESTDAPVTVSSVGGIKTDTGFKEVLSKVAEAHPNSNLADRVTSRSSQQVKIDNIVNKYRSS